MKKLTAVVIVFLLSLSFFVGTSLAKNNQQSSIPDVDGVYDDPGHPGIKVRVFVHKQKPDSSHGKPNPSPTPTPSIFCNLGDPGSDAVDSPVGWELPYTWSYNLNPSSVPSSVGSNNLATFADTALNAWSGASNGKVIFTNGGNTTTNREAYDGQNVIAWGHTSGTALAVTYTRYISSTGQVVDVDTIMNSKFPWSWSNQAQCAYSGSYDAQDILTHELGHWMGLDDHYTADYQNNTMYGYGSKEEVKKDTLTNGDIIGITNIYH